LKNTRFILTDTILWGFNFPQSRKKNQFSSRLTLCVLRGLNLAPKVIQTLATQVFPNLESLADIYLSLHETGIKDSEFAALFSGLKNGVLKNNKYFGVAIFEPALTGKAFEVLAADILPQLQNVEIFGCYLFGNPNFQDESFIKFNKSWQKVASNIAKIIFKFEHTGITDKGIKEFALKTLPAMKNLKTADISFGNTARLGDEGIVNLFHGFGGHVERLSSLDLSLSYTGVTDVGIEAIKRRQDLEAWKKFSLDISGTKVSQGNQSFVKQHFKK